MNQVYHHYQTWEDRGYGMYEKACFMDAQALQQECTELLSCPEWLRECMVFVAYHWQCASEQNLTNLHRNRQAWLGQAACCFMHGAPEYITKLAWNTLSPAQMMRANSVADEVIGMWEERYRRGAHSWQN